MFLCLSKTGSRAMTKQQGLELTPEQAEALFPELFRIARKLRARGDGVRLHSLRQGIDPETGEGGTIVKVVGAPGRAEGT